VNILVVDDDPHIVRALAITLKGQGYTVVTATDGESALRAAAQRPIAVMILDLGLPDMDGNAVIAAVREWSAVPILVLSARHDAATAAQCLLRLCQSTLHAIARDQTLSNGQVLPGILVGDADLLQPPKQLRGCANVIGQRLQPGCKRRIGS